MKKKLNFLFVSSDKYPPFRVDVSVLFGQKFADRGHSIDWLLQSEKEIKKNYKKKYINGEYWICNTDNGTSFLSRLKKHAISVMHDFRMFSLVKNKGYDFIQVKDKFVSAIAAVLIAKIYRTRFIYWLSYPFPEANLYSVSEGTARYPLAYCVRGGIYSFLLYSVIIPNADHVFVQSEKMKQDIMSRGVDGNKLTPVPMGILPELFSNNGDASDSQEEPYHPNVLYLGTLIKTRKLDFIIRVFSLVVKKVPDAKLYVVGKGDSQSDVDFLKDESKKLGIADSVVFTGFLKRKEALKYVKKTAVCVSPFFPTPVLNSTSPTKLIEYMAMGKAVIANHHPEQNTIIRESGGGLTVPYEENAFAGAIVTLLQNPKTALQMGKKGKDYVYRNRSYEIIADMVEKKYLAITGSGDGCVS